MRRHLFTVTRAGRPVAVVLAREFADAVGIAARLAAVESAPANDGPAPTPFAAAELRARRPTAGERRRFAVAASRLWGEVALVGLAL